MVGTLTSVLTAPGELGEFLQAYIDETGGDPSEVCCLVFEPWLPDFTGPRDICPTYEASIRTLWLNFPRAGLTLPVCIPKDLRPVIVDGTIEAYGMRKARAGVWALSPSLMVPGLVHCYLVFHGVPDPAPWEASLIVVVSR